ncbi:MAG: diaminopimelate epimerase [Lachnospiraceae bacterium]|jgi:diaminopimelate epimerase|nr:diaminopimelate epimerase [Lachnospiraceae bacterium]
MKFTKMQGCGNDYVYVNTFEETVKDPEKISRNISDRHFGIGSDGLVLIGPSDIADVKMSIFNADGSEAKMCGNGIRCVGKYSYDNGLVKDTKMSVETLSGVKTLDLTVGDDNKVVSVRVVMGKPEFRTKEIPVIYPKPLLMREPLEIGGYPWEVTAVSMGNPHAVVFVDDPNELNLEKIGPLFEYADCFPEGVNTEFVRVIDTHVIEMRVWERGSAETLACGTGACASAVASIANGYCTSPVRVILIGGELMIEWDKKSDEIYMTGPAVTVFTGNWEF